MFSLDEHIKRIGSKTTDKKWRLVSQWGILDAQEQLTLLSVVQSCSNSNSSKILCTSSLLASLKSIRSIATEKRWRHRFLDAQWQLTPLSAVGSGQNSNSSKLLCMSSLPARMKKIPSEMKALEWPQHYSNYKSTGIFPDAISAVRCRIWPNFELIVVLVTCNN